MAQVDSQERVVGLLQGNVPGPLQHAGCGELLSLRELLVHAVPPLEVVTDYQNNIDGIDDGKDKCVASNNRRATFWRLIWQKLEDFGEDNVKFIKIPSQCSWSSVLSGQVQMSIADWAGNKAADTGAKAGAALHNLP